MAWLKSTTKRRRWLLAAVALVLLFVAFLLALPLWLPSLLPTLARKAGVTYSAYHSLGYQRFALDNVAFTNRTLRFHAARVEAYEPSAWAWRHFLGPSGHAQFVSVSNWNLQILPAKASSGKTNSAFGTANTVATTLKKVESWIPYAQFSRGELQLGAKPLEVFSLTWTNGQLLGEFDFEGAPGPFELDAATTTNPSEIRVHSDFSHVDARVRLDRGAASLKVDGTITWLSNRAELLADFSANGMLPEHASFTSRDFLVPAELLHLPGYRDLVGSLSATWLGTQFSLDLSANAQPQVVRTNVPPLDLQFHASGDTNSAIINSAKLSSPWLTAEASPELQLFFTGQLLRQPAVFKLSADLARQPWLPLEGTLGGSATFQPVGRELPAAHIRLAGTNAGTHALLARNLRVEADLLWPSCKVSRLDADFEDGSTLVGRADADLAQKTLSAGHLQLNGRLARKWLPPTVSFDNAALTVDFHGPFSLAEMQHQGTLLATNVSLPQLLPLQLQAQWQGQGLDLPELEVQLRTARGELALGGGLTLSRGRQSLDLRKLTLRTNDLSLLELRAPALISLSGTGTNRLLELSALNWSGSAGELHLAGTLGWPSRGTLQCSARGLESSLASAFFDKDFKETRLEQLAASASWTNGPMDFALKLSATASSALLARLPVGPKQPGGGAAPVELPPRFGADLEIAGTPGGIVLSNFSLTTSTSVVAVAHGFLPATISPAARPHPLELDTNQPLELHVTAKPNTFLWRELADRTGVRLSEPDLSLTLAGSWAAPRGEARFHANHVKLPLARIPELSGIDLSAELDREQASVQECHFQVEGQPFSLSASVPVSRVDWRDWKHTLPFEQASATVRAQQVKLAPFAPLLPRFLNPEGALTLNVVLRPGGLLEGGLAIHGARTRPLATLGPVRDIEAELVFQGRKFEISNASAKIGGATVRLAGVSGIPDFARLEEEEPAFQFRLNGADVPLSRKADSIIRADLNLELKKTNGAPPLISGDVNLRDCYYLSDLRTLLPGKLATPKSRPPYFSIDEPLLSDWRLGVHVTGDKFLKARSTVFNGEVSANLRVTGTLGSPLAAGDVRINSGAIRFPFGTIPLQQGFVTLSTDDPYHPHLLLHAAGRQFGYDVKMDVTGPADVPNLQFTSTPPLSSEQILLMLTAGQLPTQEQTFTSQQRAQTFALYLGRDLLSRLGIGDQGEERLIIHSGEDITETGKPTYNLEYKLTPRWSVVGEYDQFNDFNAGLKWNLYSK